MSLLFNANDEFADSTGVTDNTSAGTFLFWVYPTNVTGAKDYVTKRSSGDGTRIRLNTSIQFIKDRGTTDMKIFVATSAISTFGIDKWCCLAFVYDVTKADAEQKIYHGDMNTDFVEASSYTNQLAGTGLNIDDSGNVVRVGNTLSTSPANKPADARIALVGFWSENLTLAQLVAQQHSMSNTRTNANTVFFAKFDAVPTELSGNAVTWAVTGATQDQQVPLAVALPTLIGPEVESGDIEAFGRGTGATRGSLDIGIALEP